MTVVNIRSGQPYDVYIGRPGKGLDGRWGNPFSHRPNTQARFRVASVDEAIAAYRRWLWQQIASGQVQVAELAELHGRTLGCFCKPGPCHGDVLQAAAAWAHAQLHP